MKGPDYSGRPPPTTTPAADWQWNVPTLQDETNFYTNVMGWTIPAGADDWVGDRNWTSHTNWGFGDMHAVTEGDEQWTWNQQFKRWGNKVIGGGSTVGDWDTELTNDCISGLLAALDASDGPSSGRDYDHMWGQGLCVVYNDTNDAAILPVLTGLRTRIEAISDYQTLASGGNLTVAEYEGRGWARKSLVASYATEATNDLSWITMRDNFRRAYETSPDWEDFNTTPAIKNGGGMFFASRQQHFFMRNNVDWVALTGLDHYQAYDAGYRVHSTFQIGLMAETMWRMWIQTGSEILRERLIKMARYVQWYAHRSSWNWPNVGNRFGHAPDGDYFHNSPQDGVSLGEASKDPSYDMSIINVMVFGYKLTGEQEMLDFAATLFSRGNRFRQAAPFTEKDNSVTNNEVWNYLDTIAAAGQTRFDFNKGQLQYCYQVIENGGAPSIMDDGGPIQTLANSMSSNTWQELTTGDTSTLTTLKNSPTGDSIFEFASQCFWNPNAKEIHFRGGGKSTGGSDNSHRHLRYRDATGDWTAVTRFLSGQKWTHQWGWFTGDPRTGDLYFRRLASGADYPRIHKWTYQRYPWSSSDTTGNDSWPEHIVGDSIVYSNRDCLEFFPDLNNGEGGFAIIDGGSGGGVLLSDPTGANWTRYDAQLVNSQYELVSCYLPNQQQILYGGGKYFSGGSITSYELSRVDVNGNATSLRNTPFVIGTGASTGFIVAFPNGRIFGLDINGNLLREYNYSTDQWTTVGSLPFDGWWTAGCAIPEWNVIYVAAQYSSGGGTAMHEWLYKL
jgi:hypothetical protein